MKHDIEAIIEEINVIRTDNLDHSINIAAQLIAKARMERDEARHDFQELAHASNRLVERTVLKVYQHLSKRTAERDAAIAELEQLKSVVETELAPLRKLREMVLQEDIPRATLRTDPA